MAPDLGEFQQGQRDTDVRSTPYQPLELHVSFDRTDRRKGTTSRCTRPHDVVACHVIMRFKDEKRRRTCLEGEGYV